MPFLLAAWKSIRSNPYFVVGSTAFCGAAVSAIQDELASGRIDWTRSGINKLIGYTISPTVAAIVHLYRTPPGGNPNAK